MSDQVPPPPPPPPPPGMPPAGAPGPAPWTGPPLAEWPQRAIGGLIDFIAPGIVTAIFFQLSTALGFILWLASLGWAVYNAYLNGATGKSVGKQVVGLKVISETNGQLIGVGNGIVRWLAHFVDAIICYLGFLLPIIDPKKQTIADKIMKTVVIVDKT